MAGDSEQLAPILSSHYPKLDVPLFGSLLDCVMRRHETVALPVENGIEDCITSTQYSDLSMVSTIVQLRENFR
jgi:hypothetical protein